MNKTNGITISMSILATGKGHMFSGTDLRKTCEAACAVLDPDSASALRKLVAPRLEDRPLTSCQVTTTGAQIVVLDTEVVS